MILAESALETPRTCRPETGSAVINTRTVCREIASDPMDSRRNPDHQPAPAKPFEATWSKTFIVLEESSG